MEEVPQFPLTLSEDNIEEVSRKIFGDLRPEWKYEDTVIERASGGFLNMVLLCFANHHKNKKDGLVLKQCDEVFSGATGTWKQAARFLTKHKLGAPILAFLDNGVCIQMVDGQSFGFESSRSLDDDYRDLVAEEMARWHCQKILQDAKSMGIRRWTALGIPVSDYWDEMFVQNDLLRAHKNKYPNSKELVEASDQFEREMLENQELDEVFCHLDFNGANIFINVDNGKGIELIDFDCVGISYAQHDIAWYLRIMREISEPRSGPGHEYELKLLQHYLRNRNKHDGKADPTDTDVERLYRQVQKAKVLVDLRIITCSTNVTYFHGEKSLPVVEDFGAIFIPRSMQYWKEFEEQKAKFRDSASIK